MRFISLREFNSSPTKTRSALAQEGKLVLTNNGKPAMLVLDISSQDFEDVIDILNRAEAMKLLDQIQSQSARAGLDAMSADQIDNEIKKYRRKARPR